MRRRRQHRAVPPRRRPRVRAHRPLPAQGRTAVAGHRVRRQRDLSAARLEHRARQRPGLRAGRGLRAAPCGAVARWRGLAAACAGRRSGDRNRHRGRDRLMDGAGVAQPQQRSTRSTCCYCGVGCGVLIHSAHEADGPSRITGVEGDPHHPANAGRLCSKGRALADSARSLHGRVLQPELRERRGDARRAVDWGLALDTVAERLAGIVERHGPDSVAFYLSGQLLTEDYYVFNKLAKGLIGTANIDTNSRLCMSSAVSGYKLAFGADGPPTCYDDLEHAKTVLFAGSNAAYAHPVLFRRLEEAKARDPGARWIVVDPRRTDTAAMADLHLQIQPGTDVALFNGMLHHLVWEGLLDEGFIAAHTTGFAGLKQLLR